MRLHLPSRLCLGAACAVLLSASPALARWRAPQPAPPVVAKPNRPAVRTAPRPYAKSAQKQEHLQQWMERHSNLSLQDQLRALDNEPGFREYPPQVQQRLRDELVRLYNMNPQERERILNRNETLERLTPEQRQRWNAAVQQFNALPPPRFRLMKAAILHLREMPPAQRDEVIDSAPFRSQFSDGERNLLKSLLMAEPYPAEGQSENP